MEMRELRGDDVFTMLNIVGQLEIEEEFKALFETNINESADNKIIELNDHKKKEPTKKEQQSLAIEKVEAERGQALRTADFGAKLLTKFIRNASKLRDEINPFLAELTESDVQTVKNLGLVEYTNLIKTFFQKEELKDFFSSIATLV